MLKAAGKVIQMGTEIIGSNFAIFENLRAIGLEELALELRILSNEMTPPINGKMPVGSGAVKSVNHRYPSVSMAGHRMKL